MDFTKLSLQELKTLQDEISVAIRDFEKRKKVERLAEIKALAKSKGFSLEEIIGNFKRKSTRPSVTPKYADPSNLDNT